MSAELWAPQVVLYHDPCDDGFTAAWAAWRRWPDAEYLPVKYGQVLPCQCAGSRVLVVDFSYKRDDMMQLSAMAASVVVLDHHKTAVGELSGFHSFDRDHTGVQASLDFWQERESKTPTPANVLVCMDMTRSGARITWDFCHPGQPVPQLVLAVEDRDLWVYQYDYTRPVHMYLQSVERSFAAWELAHVSLEDSGARVLNEGGAVLKYYNRLIADMVATRNNIELEHNGQTYKVPAVNCPGMFASDVGNALLLAEPQAPFSACYNITGGGTKYSLRSEDDRCDVSAIAAARGGGGHRNAAGFFQRN